MNDFSGNVAVVTGAASGIGAAMAQECASLGMNVVAADIEEAPLRARCEELITRGVECLGVVTDVSSADSVEELAKQAFSRFGAVHLLVNNAGVAVGGNSWDQSLDEYQWTFGVNFWGVVHGIRSFVPRLIEQGSPAHVVNVASMAGVTSAPGLAAYYASKHAVVSLSETLFFETTEGAYPHIGVSVVCPEGVKTRIGTGKRNRPERFSTEGPMSEEKELYETGIHDLTSSAKTLPVDIAKRTIAGIREGRFYILPDDGDRFCDAMKARCNALLERHNPEFIVPIG